MTYVISYKNPLINTYPVVALVRFDCGHQLLYSAFDRYSIGQEVVCRACRDQYHRVKTVRSWPGRIEMLLDCGHITVDTVDPLELGTRFSYLLKETDVLCETCSEVPPLLEE